MDYNIFIEEWIKRAERKEEVDFIDMGDKFISLWIAFNGWLKKEFSETDTDRGLINKAIGHDQLNETFKVFNKKDKEFLNNLLELSGYEILNMQDPSNESKKSRYDGTFKSLMLSLYAIRCNLFHGRKSVDENETDEELVTLAYKILLPLFKNIISKNEFT